jgi:hypothetical protein
MATRPRESVRELWERHLQASQAWIASGFTDKAAVSEAVGVAGRWLGLYPDKADAVTQIALSSAFTALMAGDHEQAADFASVVVEASSFAPAATQDERMAVALGALTFAEACLETGKLSAGGEALEYARTLCEEIEAASALPAWINAQRDLLAAASAEAVLERRQAVTLYAAARDSVEPLIRNAKLRKELVREWLRIVYGGAHETMGMQAEGEALVQRFARDHFLRAALGAARTADEGAAAEMAAAAAEACAEFGFPSGASAVDVHAALERVPAEARIEALDKIIAHAGTAERTNLALHAMLMGLRARVPGNAQSARDLAQGFDAAAMSSDGYATATLLMDTIEIDDRSPARAGAGLLHAFLATYSMLPRRLPLLAHFERTLRRITADALASYSRNRTPETSAHLSACLEMCRTSRPSSGASDTERLPKALRKAQAAASDWLGRIAHAIGRRRDAIVLIPVAAADGIAIITVVDGDSGGVEIHETTPDFRSAAAALGQGMHEHFGPAPPATGLAGAGAAAYAALPARVKELLLEKHTILVASDQSVEQSGIPYELFHGAAGFLGITHVIARLPSLRHVALALEPAVLQASRLPRAVCGAAPNTADPPLRFAAAEVAEVRAILSAARWKVPELKEAQMTPKLLLQGFELAPLVHVAAHGGSLGGAYAILLPHGKNLGTDAIASHRGDLTAAVYLSACSVGASEYLGGGVSRGLAQALMAKGSPAILASQWPLEDSAAKRFAAEFYNAALVAPMGEALRSARALQAPLIPDAWWAALILMGDPWHRLAGAQAIAEDPATALIQVAADPHGREATPGALKAARRAHRKDPADLRLSAAVTWAAEAGSLFEPSSRSAISPEWAEAMARIAADLGARVGEGFCEIAAHDLLTQDGRDAESRAALDRAIDIFETLSRADERWSDLASTLLTRRKALRGDPEPREIRLASGMTVNDRSDPAVNALLDLQAAVDEKDTRRGAVELRLPDRCLEDTCWNAVVLGRMTRFPDEYACAGFARQFAARGAASGTIAAPLEADARRVAGGLLYFLWSSQRIGHLSRDMATGQSGTLCVAMESLAEVSTDAETVRAKAAIVELGDALRARGSESAGDRYARTREKLKGKAGGASASLLGRAVRELVERAQGPMRSHRIAWGCGYLLEVAFDLSIAGRDALAASVIAEHGDLNANIEGALMGYLMPGWAPVREAPAEPLMAWEYERA